MVRKRAEYVGFVDCELDRGRSPFVREGRSLSVQSAHFEMVEMDKIVSEKKGWVTRASTQHTKRASAL